MEKYNKILEEIEKDLNLMDPKLKEWNLNYFSNQKKRYISDLKFIEHYYKKGEILEVGSLPCHLTALLKKLSYSVIGLDLNPNRAKEFIEKYKLTVIKCDIENDKIPFENDRFNFIIFNEIFEHLRIDPISTLKELNRVLSPSGIMMLTTPNLYSLPNIISFLLGRGFNDPYEEFEKLHTIGHMGHIREYSIKEVIRFLENTGFEVTDIKFRKYEGDRKSIIPILEKKVGPVKAKLLSPALAIVDLCYNINPMWLPLQMIISKKKI